MGLVKRNRVESEIPTTETDPSVLPAGDLLDLLRSSDAGCRRRAAEHVNSSTPPAALSDVFEALDREENQAVRSALITALTGSGHGEVVCYFTEKLQSENAQVRNEAVEALQNFPELIDRHMNDLLRHPDVDVRILAVEILTSLRHSDVTEWLHQVLQQDEDINVCAAAIDKLIEVGTEESIPLLLQTSQRFPKDFIRFAVNIAVKRIQGK